VGVRDLVYAGQAPASLTDLRRHLTSAGPTGLEVLPGVGEAGHPGPTAEELWYALDILECWFPVVIVDAPPDWGRPPSAALLNRTDTLVVVMRAGEPEPASVGRMLAGLDHAERRDLVAGCVVAMVEVTPPRLFGRPRRRPGRFAQDAHAVVAVPYDPALAGGRPFGWHRLRRRTRVAFEELAAAVESS
jgi:MinD-like ATPase involved in chromosome partitioning or flagellar assembly